jgi:hypothetical protein
MRKITFILFSVVVSLSVSCKKDIQLVTVLPENTDNQKEIIASGAWKVTYFNDNGTDLTSDFNTYLFQFESDGSAVTSSSGIGILYFGVWNIMEVSHCKKGRTGNLQGVSENINLLITLNGSYHMDEMSGKWLIAKLTTSEIWLKEGNRNSMKEIHLVLI